MRQVDSVAYMGNKEINVKLWMKNVIGRDSLGEDRVDWRIIL
jgi:hypothetical protein